MSTAVLRSLDRERDKLVKRRQLLAAKERRARDAMQKKLRVVTDERAKLEELIEQMDIAVKAVEAVLGSARAAQPAKASDVSVPALLNPEQKKLVATGSDGTPATDVERVRLALVLGGEMNNWQIAEAASVPVASVHTHLASLVNRGQVERVSRGRYRAVSAAA